MTMPIYEQTGVSCSFVSDGAEPTIVDQCPDGKLYVILAVIGIVSMAITLGVLLALYVGGAA